MGKTACFSPDGKLLADSPAHGVVRLTRLEDGRELARLEDPNQDEGIICFSPDSTRLVITNNTSGSIHIWDLRAVRKELADLDLDWHMPAYRKAEASTPIESVLVDLTGSGAGAATAANRNALLPQLAAYSLQIALTPYHPQPYDWRGRVHTARSEYKAAVEDFTAALRWQPRDAKRRARLYLTRSFSLMQLHRDADAAADLQQAVQLDPSQPTAFNNLAQIYVNGVATLRDPRKALVLAERGLQVAPGDWYCRNSLGVAHYRLGHYEQAIVALERCLRDSKDERAAFQLYFLAMCYARLGDVLNARDCYDKAARWMPERLDQLPPNWRCACKRSAPKPMRCLQT